MSPHFLVSPRFVAASEILNAADAARMQPGVILSASNDGVFIDKPDGERERERDAALLQRVRRMTME